MTDSIALVLSVTEAVGRGGQSCGRKASSREEEKGENEMKRREKESGLSDSGGSAR
jgi:hypothetical protein